MVSILSERDWRKIALLLILSIVGCTSIRFPRGIQENIDLNKPNRTKEYKLIDFNGINHLYKDNLNNVVFPRHNKLLTQYCRLHKTWEDIQARWSQDKLSEPGNYRYNYFVKENTK
jgi:hypothetical protein